MISVISGTLAHVEANYAEVETPGGVAYEVEVADHVLTALPAAGEPVRLHVHHVVREDAQYLFGFLDRSERTLFRVLITASGLGPKVALAMISSLGAAEVIRAFRDRDAKALTAVSGVGMKKAEKFVLDLGTKAGELKLEGVKMAPSGKAAGDAVNALVVLGYDATVAREAVRAALADGPESESALIIRRAMALLAA